MLTLASAQWYPALGGYFVLPGNYQNRTRYYTAPYATPYAIQYTGQYGGPITTQYHLQNVAGQTSYGYAYPGQAATNYRDAFGNQVGSYAYINPDGKEIQVSYSADSNGFRVVSNTLPVAPVYYGKAPEPVKDTAEVAAAKAEFAKLYRKAAAAAAATPEKLVAP